MTPERVDEMLKSYRHDMGRCGHLLTEIDMLKQEIAKQKSTIVSDLVGPGAQVITDMPRGTMMGNPTEKYGLMLAEGWEPDVIREMREKIAQMQAEYNERQKTVIYVSNWLKCLPERERWIIEMYVIDNVIWAEILVKYQQEFGEYRSKDTLKRLRDRALEMVYDMAE